MSIPRQEISLHECLADVHMIAEHMVLSCQGKNRAETASMWHRAESIFKVAKACVVLSAHVLALNDQADFAFLELAVFAFDLVVKPGGENFVLRSKRRSEDLYPALATIESVHFRCFSYEPRWLERTTQCRAVGKGVKSCAVVLC